MANEKTPQQTESAKKWQARIESCRKARKALKDEWDTNIAFRLQKPYTDESDEDRVAVPQDWSRTRAKEAQLFSQMPTVTLSALDKRFAQAVPILQKEFNHVLAHQAKPEVAMEECLADLVNAAGFCAAIVKYEATFTEKEVPSVDLSVLPPDAAMALMQSGQVPMEKVPMPVSQRFVMRRISPAQLVWDTRFKGSDWNDASFIGHEGSLPWAVAKREFSLRDADKEAVLGATKPELLGDADEESCEDDRQVNFTEIFYKAAMFDPEELHLDKLRRIVFVEGITDRAVIDEEYQGQQYDEESGEYVGVCGKFPIQVCTLVYVSDQLIPPSDSEIGRPMVQEQMRSRTQQMLQRDRSIPTRWHNTNRIDPSVSALLEKGIFQGSVPVNGDGSTAMGEIARAA